MKKIISLVLVALLIAGTAFAFNIPSPGVGDKMGAGQFASQPGKIFRLVRNPESGGVDGNHPGLSADSLVVLDTSSDDGVTIGTTTTSGDSTVVGVLVTNIATSDNAGGTAAQDIGRRNWGWMQTYGLTQVSIDSAGPVMVKGAFGSGTTAGKAAGYNTSSGDLTLTELTALGAVGFMVDAGTASGNNIEAFIIRD